MVRETAVHAGSRSQRLAARIDAYERLLRLDKPIGALLLLWPTLWAVWLASRGAPRLDVLIVFVVGTFLMRSAGCAFNDFADRRFDAHVERHKHAPSTSGEGGPSITHLDAGDGR